MRVRVDGRGMTGGTVRVGGFKHALVSLVATSVAAGVPVEIGGAPEILETRIFAEILNACGARAESSPGRLRIDPRGLSRAEVPEELSRQIHGAAYLIPAFLARLGEVRIGHIGGCRIGPASEGGSRPLRHMLAVLERLGARFRTVDGQLVGEARALRPARVDIREFSIAEGFLAGPYISGATKTALIGAAGVPSGEVEILHPYGKPDVTEAAGFLALAGRRVEWEGPSLRIAGGPPCAAAEPLRVDLPPDLCEVLTFIAAAVHRRVPIRICDLDTGKLRQGMAPELRTLCEMGIELVWRERSLELADVSGIRGLRLHVASTDTCIYSDNQPFFSLMLLGATGPSRVHEQVWTDRFSGWVPELVRLGARITAKDGVLEIEPSALRSHGLSLHAPDLRAAAVLVLAALGAEGVSTVSGVEHIGRGYQDFFPKLRGLGADITAAS